MHDRFIAMLEEEGNLFTRELVLARELWPLSSPSLRWDGSLLYIYISETITFLFFYILNGLLSPDRNSSEQDSLFVSEGEKGIT
jgi:hypothetical protein